MTQRSASHRHEDGTNADSATDLLADRTLVVASNRGPVSFTMNQEGKFSTRKGSGGVVTAVSAIARDRQPIWVAAAMTEGDRARAKQAAQNGEVTISPPGERPDFRLRFVVP